MGIFRRFLADLGLIRNKTVVVRNELTVSALQELAAKKQLSPDELASRMLDAAIEQEKGHDADIDWWDTLSIREQQVVALAVKRYTNNQIALILNISPSTVKTYFFTASRKAGVNGRKELAEKFFEFDFENWIRDNIGNLPPISG